METLLLAIAVVILVYVAIMVLLPRRMTGDGQSYTQKALARMMKENVDFVDNAPADVAALLKDQIASASPLVKGFFALPGAKMLYEMLLKAGFGGRMLKFFLGLVVVFFAVMIAVSRFHLGFPGFLGAILLTAFLGYKYLVRRVRRRNDVFINMFPDALDMIVRSVRSGFPLNTALRMIAENMDAPISTEFRQVVDEVAYGRSLNEALHRMALRIDQPDIQFFVVVLAVQQESGGNLAEVLNNLSSIIRKRKQLRLKIRALTSEGRATAWVLGSLPVFVFMILMFIAPTHLTPLFNTPQGNLVLGGAIGLVAFGGWIVSQMADIEI